MFNNKGDLLSMLDKNAFQLRSFYFHFWMTSLPSSQLVAVLSQVERRLPY